LSEGPAAAELFHTLVSSPHVRVERILSQGQASPAGFWYDQVEDEFVLLVSGAACVEFENGVTVELRANDWLNIPAHVRHRVAWTATDTPSVWLAVFTQAR
jgi:cupin 2 domain-containing protein